MLPVIACLVSACGGDSSSPTSPSRTNAPPVVPLCQSQNTATLTLENRTVNLTHDVYVDSIRVGTLSPGQQTAAQTVVAGVQHSVLFRYTNTTRTACFATPIPIQCSTQLYYCSF